MKRVIFFTASNQTTPTEATAIAALHAATDQQFEVQVMSAGSVGNMLAVGGGPDYGSGRPAPADYVAGTIPAEFSAVPVFDPVNPPAPSPTQVVIHDTQSIACLPSGHVVFHIANGAIVSATYTA